MVHELHRLPPTLVFEKDDGASIAGAVISLTSRTAVIAEMHLMGDE
jgi:hypothetical protein